MHTSFRPFPLLCASLIFLAASASSHAEIYKWVDAGGKTHYSEKKEGAGNAKTVEVKVNAAAPATAPTRTTHSGNGNRPSWQEQDELSRQKQGQKSDDSSTSTAPPKALSNGRSDDTSASKCNLAKDVLSGAVRHTNGKPTDEYDRDVAKNDVKSFCK